MAHINKIHYFCIVKLQIIVTNFKQIFLYLFIMNITHIEHVGIAVTSLEQAIPFMKTFLVQNVLQLKKWQIKK